MHYRDIVNETLELKQLTSDLVVVSKPELEEILTQHKYFK